MKTGISIIGRFSQFIMTHFTVSNQRKQAVYKEIITGSDPSFNYYLLLLLSALISAFGLIANSPAVVIGAMLVCPLMMPIFGISLSLVTGDTLLLRAAMLAETGGILLVVGASFLLGISPFTFEMTHEILAMTNPTLLDLFVAALAGFAGCLAMIDERISPILPGIAIATSLTPPLAGCGLCLALGSFEGSMGAFILFLANFLTILLVGSMTFIASGFIKGGFGEHKALFAKRFALAAISLIAITLFLCHAMIRLVEEKTTISTIKKTVLAELSDVQNLEIKEITLDRSADGRDLNALVVLDAPAEPASYYLQIIEDKLQKKLGKPVNLFIRTRITKSISSSQDKLIHFYRNADGIKTVPRPGQDVQILNIASQIVRERIEEIPGMQVTDIELRYSRNGKKIIYTTIQGPIRPFPGGIKITERRIQKALKNNNIRLTARYIESYEVSADTTNITDLAGESKESPKSRKLKELANDLITKELSFSLQAIKAGFVENRWIVVAEVSGHTVMTKEQTSAIQSKLRDSIKENVSFMAFSKAEAMLSGKPEN